jgi:hypothetical protein
MIYRQHTRKSIDESSEENDIMINEFLKSANYREQDINDISPIAPLKPEARAVNKILPKTLPKTPSPNKKDEVSHFVDQKEPYFSSTAAMGNTTLE